MPPMMAWNVESQKGVKLFAGIPISPSFPYIHSVVQEAWDNAWKPSPTVRVFERAHGVATAREKLAEKFLDGDWTHFLMLDGDIVVKSDTIQKLLEVNKPIALGLYYETSNQRLPEVFHHSRVPFRRDAPIDFKLHDVLEYPQQNGEDVLLSGLGILMIKREIFEKIEKPYFLFSSEFEHKLKDDWWSVSEDFFFMLKLQEAGLKITYCPDISVCHLGTAVVCGPNNVGFV